MADEKVQIIEAVKTPLGFFVLVVLVVEVIFGFTASNTNSKEIVVAMIALIFLLVGIVAFLSYRRPEALSGARYSEEPELAKIRQEFQEKEHLADMVAGEWTFSTHYQPEGDDKSREMKGCCEIRKGKYGVSMHGSCLGQDGNPGASFVVRQVFVNEDGLTYIYEVPLDLGKAVLGVGQVGFVDYEGETPVSHMRGNWAVLGSRLGGKAEFIRKR